MYPIGGKLVFHAFMGPEGQYKHFFKQDDSSYNYFELISVRQGFKKKKKVKLGLLAELRGVGV